jgi:hypothetical protein
MSQLYNLTIANMRTVCGLDVHKDRVFMCILHPHRDKIEEKFSTLTPDLDRMCDLIVCHGVQEVCMERISIYWMFIWRLLESDFPLKLVNPLNFAENIIGSLRKII